MLCEYIAILLTLAKNRNASNLNMHNSKLWPIEKSAWKKAEKTKKDNPQGSTLSIARLPGAGKTRGGAGRI